MNRITSAIDAVRVDDMHSTEEQFRAAHPLCWQMTLYGPVLLTLSVLGVLLVQTGWEFTSKVITSAVITVCLLGRFIILSGSDGTFNDTNGSLASEHLFALVCYLDVMTALMLAFHIGFLFRLPYVGTRIAALVTDGHFILDSQPWMRRATFIGLIAFVGFPLAATGSIGGSIFGRLLGMSRLATFFGIVTGTLVGNSAMFWFSDLLGHYFDKENFYLKYGGLLIIVAIVIVLERRYRKLKQRYAIAQAASAAPQQSYPVGAPIGDHVAKSVEIPAVDIPAFGTPAVEASSVVVTPLQSETALQSANKVDTKDRIAGEHDSRLEVVAGERLGSRHHTG
jgi:uncharacterized membrane protein